MKSTLSRISAALAFLSVAVAVGLEKPAIAQTCTPLAVVEGNGDTSVTKTVTLPGALFIDSNWNTDFVVNIPYSYYVATVDSQSGNPYDVQVFLKYPDGSADESYSAENLSIDPDVPLVITAEPRARTNPFQVNLEVGGLNAEGNVYTAYVSGCR